ncbi:uncharacterized protein LOC129074724 [Pteronotus mesoamericanus]|uniref:uncharacterized protein LOC129074724 n=1 Tax=Pteronotus mesoamericanus TaxID=1884717 RepID=UPI0023EAEEC7|nr:uncharacterized protein LOC129074724 [Pteronotus parnellii mesoamericanus]
MVGAGPASHRAAGRARGALHPRPTGARRGGGRGGVGPRQADPRTSPGGPRAGGAKEASCSLARLVGLVDERSEPPSSPGTGLPSGRRPAWPRVCSPAPRCAACTRGTRIRGSFAANCQESPEGNDCHWTDRPLWHDVKLRIRGSGAVGSAGSSVAAAPRTQWRRRAYFKEPGSPRGQALRNARIAARAPELQGSPGERQPRAQALCRRGKIWLLQPRRGRIGAGPKSCLRAARGRCGPPLRPHPCNGGPSDVPSHRRVAGAPALARPTSSLVVLIRGRTILSSIAINLLRTRPFSSLSYYPGFRWTLLSNAAVCPEYPTRFRCYDVRLENTRRGDTAQVEGSPTVPVLKR